MDEAVVRRGRPAPTAGGATARHPDRRPAVRPGLRPARRPRPRGRARPGPHLRAAGHRPDPRDRRPGAGCRPGGPLPRGAGRQDRIAGGHLGALRRHLRRRRRALVAALTAFGEEVGVAFQISDDLLDIVSEGGTSGKAPGTDLREGIATLPALFALAGDDPAEARLRELVSRPVTDDAEHAEALAPAPLVVRAGARRRGTARLRRARPVAAGRGARRRGARRPVGALRVRRHPHLLTVAGSLPPAVATRRGVRGSWAHASAPAPGPGGRGPAGGL